jgi:hypothetical protein
MRVLTRASTRTADQPAQGFTRIDLFAILAVLTLLVLLQLPALAHNKINTRQVVCADNLRRLAISWTMFADDNQGRLVPNVFGNPTVPVTNWVGGYLDYSFNPDNTNLATITSAALYPYNRATEIYRCPEDVSRTPLWPIRVRSYSMNSWVGVGAVGWLNSVNVFQVQTNLAQVRQPDQTFVFIEEHPDSINDGVLFIDLDQTGPATQIIDLPAAYHYFGGQLGFADGSVRLRQWVDPRTSPPVTGIPPSTSFSPNNLDIAWLQGVTSYRR